MTSFRVLSDDFAIAEGFLRLVRSLSKRCVYVRASIRSLIVNKRQILQRTEF